MCLNIQIRVVVYVLSLNLDICKMSFSLNPGYHPIRMWTFTPAPQSEGNYYGVVPIRRSRLSHGQILYNKLHVN